MVIIALLRAARDGGNRQEKRRSSRGSHRRALRQVFVVCLIVGMVRNGSVNVTYYTIPLRVSQPPKKVRVVSWVESTRVPRSSINQSVTLDRSLLTSRHGKRGAQDVTRSRMTRFLQFRNCNHAMGTDSIVARREDTPSYEYVVLQCNLTWQCVCRAKNANERIRNRRKINWCRCNTRSVLYD
jgi:hypothetical protein